MVKSRPTD